jgi:phage terminase large subunit GpA-like protein
MAQEFSRQRLSELLTLSPALAELMATPRGGERSNSILVKSGRNGSLLMLAGANAPSALRSLPIKVLILDEVDGGSKLSSSEQSLAPLLRSNGAASPDAQSTRTHSRKTPE